MRWLYAKVEIFETQKWEGSWRVHDKWIVRGEEVLASGEIAEVFEDEVSDHPDVLHYLAQMGAKGWELVSHMDRKGATDSDSPRSYFVAYRFFFKMPAK